MNPRGCSIRELAAASGYSTATVSMALRGMGRVPASTRHKIMDLAVKMGYVRDEEMAKVLTRARKPPSQGPQDTLVFVSEVPIRETPDPASPALLPLFKTARDAAHLLGYKLDILTVGWDSQSQKAASRTLAARGIRGLVIGPFTQWSPARLEFDWSKFAAVEIGTTLDWPPLYRVERDYHEDLLELYEWLRERGYRRIGLAFSRLRAKFLKHIPESTLLLYERWHPEMEEVEPLSSSHEWNAEGLNKWLKKERPDVVIVFEPDVPLWLKQLNIQVPEELGLVHLIVLNPQQTGLIPDMPLMSREAIRMLVRMVTGGEWGLPERRRSHVFRSIFQPGKTVLNKVMRRRKA